MPLPKPIKANLAVCAALAAMTFAVFGRTLGHGFVDYDDNDYVYQNPMVVRGLTAQGVAWAFTTFHANNWHPLAWLSHMLDCQLYGLRPWGHHLTSVLLHTAAVIALFLVLRNMTGVLWRSAFVAAVFAIHPLRVESVAWIAERKDVLSGLFFILTIGAYVRYARARSPARYAPVLLLFALGLMSKPMLVTLPLVLLLLDYWPLQRRESPKKLVLEKFPLLALSAASCVMTFLAQRSGIQSAGSFSLPVRLGNALMACAAYLAQMIWPAGLAPFYPFPLHGLVVWKVALAGALVAGVSAAAFWQRRRQPWLWVGWFWYLAMLLPVLGIVQVGDQAHADRYTYLPQIGIYMALAWLVAQWRVDRLVFGVLMAYVLATLMYAASKQAGYWRDGETLWSHALACTPDNYVAHYNLGNAFRQEGRMDDALAQYQEAVQIRPDYPQAQNNLGKAFLAKDDLDKAMAHFQAALQINPRYAVALDNLGDALVDKGDAAGAIVQYQKELQVEPSNPAVLGKMAWLLATWPEAAVRNGGRAVELAGQANALTGGENPVMLHTLAAAYAEAGQFPQAIETARRALQLAGERSNAPLASQLQLEMKLYQAGKPFHIPMQ